MRRLRAHGRNMSTRAASELPPGPIGAPAWSRLKDRSTHSSVTDRTKAGPGAVWTPQMSMRDFSDALPASGLLERICYLSACGAPRGARRDLARSRTPIGLRFSARHPLPSGSSPRAGLMPRGLRSGGSSRHARICSGHPIGPRSVGKSDWIAGTSPAMTKQAAMIHAEPFGSPKTGTALDLKRTRDISR